MSPLSPPFPDKKLLKRIVCASLGAAFLASCAPMGPKNLRRDRLAYDRELGQGQKQEMLLNIVRVRFADPPTFLTTNQVIAGYSYTKNFQANISGNPWFNPNGNNMVGGSTALTMQDNPTITYRPLAGTQFSENVLKPIPPSVLLPLILGGARIDVLLALCAQSMGGFSNTKNVGAGPYGKGPSVSFTYLLQALRKLQETDGLTLRFGPPPPGEKVPQTGPRKTAINVAYLALPSPLNAEQDKLQKQVRELLHLAPGQREAEVVYGPYPLYKGQIAILTRSMLSIFQAISQTIQVPEKLIREGWTLPTLDSYAAGIKPPIVIHSSPEATEQGTYADVVYEGTHYWIANNDFSSKYAFTLLQIIAALASTSSSGGAIVTIPTGG